MKKILKLTPPPLWTPKLLNSPLVLDAIDSGFSYGSSTYVSQWRHMYNNSVICSQNTGSLQPLRTTLNGIPAVYFDGGDSLSLPAVFANTGWCLYCVGQFDPTLTTQAFLGAGSTIITLANDGGTATTLIRVDNVDNIPALNGYINGAAVTFTDRNSVFDSYVNNTVNIVNFNSIRGTSTALTFGVASFNFNILGYVYAFIVVSSALSTANRQKLEGYWAHRFKCTDKLPASHPYKSSPPRE